MWAIGTASAHDFREQRIPIRRARMSGREADLLWLKDVLDHLHESRQQLEWSTDRRAAVVLTESMLRDLDRCKRLCEALHRRAETHAAAG